MIRKIPVNFCVFWVILISASFFSWPVRTLGFSYDGQMLASASEDLFIDIVSP